MIDKHYEKVRPFTSHGVYFNGERTDQFFGNCPFCGGVDKFYCNKHSFLWDCKKCGLTGNLQHFLEEIVLRNIQELKKENLHKLCIDRKLPVAALTGIELGLDGLNYTFPVRDDRGRIVDIRSYRARKKVIGTAGLTTGIMGAQYIRKTSEQAVIYLCEGEWDFIAMRWLLSFLKENAIALGVPGANTFKKEWIRYFIGRTVYVCYDNDGPGEDGELKVKEALTGVAKELKFLHWSIKMPTGYDIRDLVTQEAIKKQKPKKTIKFIKASLKPETRKVDLKKQTVEQQELATSAEPPERKTLEDVHRCFGRWLFMNNYDAIDVMLSAIISNKIEGDPLWLFLVSPPGGSKTEVLSSLITSPDVYFTSSLTPPSLISGASWSSGGDPSLIPKLNGKILVIKDFTSILSKRENEKEEIFGILRDAYDGRCSKIFGNGVRREYTSRFTILGAVTPVIYDLAASHHSLGERFLKYSMGANLQHVSEEDIVDRAITNLNRETSMRKELADMVRGFLYYLSAEFNREELPVLTKEIKTKLINLAMFCARMRGTVNRDNYRPDQVNSKPSAEVGSRLGKQLAKFCIALAVVRGKKEVSEAEYLMARKVALDTISQRNEDIIHFIYREVGTNEASIRTKQLSNLTKYPHSTIARVLADMQMLEIVVRAGKSNAYEWRISPYVLDLIKKAGLYCSQDELNRPRLKPRMVKTFRRKL